MESTSMVTGSSTLLRLPIEIRLRIYNYVVDSTNVLFHPPTLYAGLLGTCREINCELEPELIKHAVRWLKQNVPNFEAKRFDPRTFKASTLYQLRNLVVLRAPEYRLARYLDFGAKSHRLDHSLAVLDLKSLTNAGVQEAHEQGLEDPDEKGPWMVTGFFSCFAVSDASGCMVQEDEEDSQSLHLSKEERRDLEYEDEPESDEEDPWLQAMRRNWATDEEEDGEGEYEEEEDENEEEEDVDGEYEEEDDVDGQYEDEAGI